MVFSDLFFLFVFIPAFVLCYLLGALIDRWCFKKADNTAPVVKNAMLVIFSLIFYAWGEPVYVFLLLLCVLINYVIGRCIAGSDKHRKAALVCGLVCNLLILGTFKYAGFLAQTLADVGVGGVAVPQIALPIGISFYIFQSISYLVDVYRNESPVQKRFVDLLLYVSMFPQLIAGPIVRYGTVAHEIGNRSVNSKGIADGVFRFLVGLAKKVIIANQLSEISDQFLAGELTRLTMGGAWLGIVAFTLQIYFDFSGYSDMAIGIGRCLGFHFNENFNHPYCCNSISDFWRRWHMSLGSFFRDYVYIPMGGNKSHQVLNIMTVWFLTGMWHGASWNFILWGLYFGIIVMAEKYTLLKVHNKIPAFVLHIYSMLLVVIGWGIFYFDDFEKMKQFFISFIGQGGSYGDFIATSAIYNNMWLWIFAVMFCMPMRKWCKMLLDYCCNPKGAANSNIVLMSKLAFSVVALLLSVSLLVGATNNAFIYTRF